METLQGVEQVIMIERHHLDSVRERLLVAGGWDRAKMEK